MVFDEGGYYILNKIAGELNWFREHNGKYMLDALIKSASQTDPNTWQKPKAQQDDIWAKVETKYHLKHLSVFSRAKLPLLFDQVKAAVDKVIQKKVHYTIGVAFTSDHLSSRNMDPYLGVTCHLITKDWKLAR